MTTNDPTHQPPKPGKTIPTRPTMGYLRVSNNDDSGLMDDNELTESLLPAAEDIPHPHVIIRASRTIRRAGHFLGYFAVIGMLFVVPVTLYQALRQKRADLAAFHSSEAMVVGTLVLSVRLVYLHLTHWYMPDVQKYVVRILWMVPLYSFQSWLSLRFHHSRIYIDAVRDLYEAFVISSFVYYIIEILGGQDALVRLLESKSDDASLGNHVFPLNLVMKPWNLGMEFMLQCKHGVLQYVVAKTLATILTFLFEWIGIYGEGQFDARVAYPYMAFLLNICVMYALYCLVKLFYAVNDELCAPINWKPLGKFLCIKGVVFFTWWQGVIIFYLRAHGVIADVGDWKAEEVANGLIDYCVCIEMVFFAMAHSISFTYKEYLPERFVAVEHQDRPMPRVMQRPMRPKDALWSSTLPQETIRDIRKMQRGIASNDESPGAISLQQQKNHEHVLVENGDCFNVI